MSYVSKAVDDRIISILKSGGVGFMPSDTIYGLSALALNKQAVEKLRIIKGRTDKPFIILINDIKILNKLSISEDQSSGMQKYWPGGITLVCDAPNSPDWLHRGLGTLAIRMPDNQQLLNLIEEVGPIVSTSANPEGRRPAQNLAQAIKYFGDGLDFYIDGGIIKGNPSTIVKQKNGRLEVIRQGRIIINGENI